MTLTALGETEIIEGKLLAAVDEMGIVLARASMSPVIYEVLDFACGICDAEGQLVAQSNGLTLFTGTFSAQVRFILRKFGRNLRPGDTFITNDPYEGGTHACDMAVIRPIFAQGQLSAFAIAVAHWLDVGGAIPGSLPPDATDIFQEGLRLPGLRLCRENRILEAIEDLIRANVRLPDLAMGDLQAELAATRIGERRVEEICRRYGRENLAAVFGAILRQSEQRSRMALAALPDGRYEAQDLIDGDGVTGDQIPVRVAVVIEGERMRVDFNGTSPACQGPVNCARGALHSAVKTVFKALVDPQAPSNEGWFSPLSIEVPDGTVFSARPPAPVGWYYEGSAQASELVWKALAPLAPERFSAGSYMSLCATYLCGRDPRRGDLFVHIEPQHGGWGACEDRDGASALIAVTDGDTYNYSVELLEAKFPLLLRRYELNLQGGSGAGRFRGGFGLLREYEIKTDEAFFYGSLGRGRERPWGLFGGQPGSVNYVELETGGETRRMARSSQVPLKKGDRVRIVTGGGGGWGQASARDRSAIAADIAEGYLTTDEAAAQYGWSPEAPLPDG